VGEGDEAELGGCLINSFQVGPSDIFTIEPDKIRDAKVLTTIVGGRVVYEAAK